MATLAVVRPDDAAWHEVLRRVAHFDFYHLPAYHDLSQRRDGGTAQLYVYTEGDYLIALPLLVRPIAQAPGSDAASWHDAGSVYGYPGPLASHEHMPRDVVAGFQEALACRLRRNAVVSVFSRLHPVLPQIPILDGLGRLDRAGVTVSIDLGQPLDVQWSAYRSNHRRDVKKLERDGVECLHDPDGRFLDDFVDIYHETMQRVAAHRGYLFDRAYVDELRARLAHRFHLYVCRSAGEISAAGVFIATNGIVQYHLGGTRAQHMKAAPMKLLFDRVRRDFAARGARILHLGGGVGCARDSLLHFKRGFGPGRHDFYVWKWVVDPDRYARLCAARGRPIAGDHACAGFFPAYRT